MARYPREVLESYVQDEKGNIHQLVAGKIKEYVYLRRGNNYKSYVRREIQQNIVNGKWKFPNEHELHRFILEDNKVIAEINRMILKRVLLTQILIEVDDWLKPHFEDDNRARNLLTKCQDHLDRKNTHLFNKVYKQDEQMAQNMLKSLDHFLTTIANKRPEDVYRISEMILEAEKDESLLPESITMSKVE